MHLTPANCLYALVFRDIDAGKLYIGIIQVDYVDGSSCVLGSWLSVLSGQPLLTGGLGTLRPNPSSSWRGLVMPSCFYSTVQASVPRHYHYAVGLSTMRPASSSGRNLIKIPHTLPAQ